jgi:alkylation response protein AidB-like acyl-CoA dehydrogenase
MDSMRFAPTEDQLALAEGVGELLNSECTPEAVRLAAASVDLPESGRLVGLWGQLTEMGVLGLEAPEDLGGTGFGPMETELVMEMAGRVALPEPLLATAGVAVPLLSGPDLSPGAAAQARAVAERAIAGATVGLGLAGQDVVHAQTADEFLLDADLGDGRGLYLVPAGAVSLSRRESIDRARPLAAVDIADRSAALRLGGAELVDQALDRAALAAAAQLIGLSETMVAMTVGYVGERRQFGVPIGSFQAIKHHMADAELAVSFARPVVRRAAYSMAMGDPAVSLHVSMAKAAASDAALRVGQLTLQCHGAIAYTVEYDHQLYLKRSWALASRYGDSGFHRERVASAVLDGN